jgi:hypothetical protein
MQARCTLPPLSSSVAIVALAAAASCSSPVDVQLLAGDGGLPGAVVVGDGGAAADAAPRAPAMPRDAAPPPPAEGIACPSGAPLQVAQGAFSDVTHVEDGVVVAEDGVGGLRLVTGQGAPMLLAADRRARLEISARLGFVYLLSREGGPVKRVPVGGGDAEVLHQGEYVDFDESSGFGFDAATKYVYFDGVSTGIGYRTWQLLRARVAPLGGVETAYAMPLGTNGSPPVAFHPLFGVFFSSSGIYGLGAWDTVPASLQPHSAESCAGRMLFKHDSMDVLCVTDYAISRIRVPDMGGSAEVFHRSTTEGASRRRIVHAQVQGDALYVGERGSTGASAIVKLDLRGSTPARPQPVVCNVEHLGSFEVGARDVAFVAGSPAARGLFLMPK